MKILVSSLFGLIANKFMKDERTTLLKPEIDICPPPQVSLEYYTSSILCSCGLGKLYPFGVIFLLLTSTLYSSGQDNLNWSGIGLWEPIQFSRIFVAVSGKVILVLSQGTWQGKVDLFCHLVMQGESLSDNGAKRARAKGDSESWTQPCGYSIWVSYPW